MSQLLDDLARTMARPLQRREALIAIGATILGLSTGEGAKATRKPVRRQAHWCHKEVRANGWKYCQEESEACFPACCPRERLCSKGPCGSNGCCEWACCDPCNPKASRPDGAGGCKPGPVPDTCTPKTCGPDITGELESALARLKTTFAGWSAAKRGFACANLVTLPGAAVSWDIRELGPGGRAAFSQRHQGCTSCGQSVQVGQGCHYSGSVNYIVYGAMMRLCHDDSSSFKDWFSSEAMLELVYIHKNQTGSQAANFQASNEWALAGYNAGPVRPYPPGDRPNCKERCDKPYSGPGLTINWLPFVIGPR